MRSCLCASAGIAAHNEPSTGRFGLHIDQAIPSGAGRGLDQKAVGSGEEEMGHEQGEMGGLPEAVEHKET